MTLEQAIDRYTNNAEYERIHGSLQGCLDFRQLAEWLKDYKRLLEQQPCGMTAEEYRQRMIQAFHNADTDELIAVCVLPTEKEFEHLEWLLKNHYKKDPCEESEDKTE